MTTTNAGSDHGSDAETRKIEPQRHDSDMKDRYEVPNLTCDHGQPSKKALPAPTARKSHSMTDVYNVPPSTLLSLFSRKKVALNNYLGTTTWTSLLASPNQACAHEFSRINDCPAGHFCDATIQTCVPQHGLGEQCTQSLECASHYCHHSRCASLDIDYTNNLKSGQIAGIVIGVVATLFCFLYFLLWCQNKQSRLRLQRAKQFQQFHNIDSELYPRRKHGASTGQWGFLSQAFRKPAGSSDPENEGIVHSNEVLMPDTKKKTEDEQRSITDTISTYKPIMPQSKPSDSFASDVYSKYQNGQTAAKHTSIIPIGQPLKPTTANTPPEMPQPLKRQSYDRQSTSRHSIYSQGSYTIGRPVRQSMASSVSTITERTLHQGGLWDDGLVSSSGSDRHYSRYSYQSQQHSVCAYDDWSYHEGPISLSSYTSDHDLASIARNSIASAITYHQKRY
ncbi:uncharacterized protein BYT42DRAFT_382049 [Radiomyces spectabilis]|uniref:uncharacterized protein n=1 Tax=Radiomyces spectabilis TaxID=64574 RepID=UPI002220BEC3|nr:uncharacterized protein BYT42DRAFT_382049 [Radiomyces spectabilis]KAI8376303.1 hypothetical protein BYT42DRAFT_382049 [Radiomyces spectabilis]